ncbi:hypothetical protein ACGFYV_09115 [Streptomyces sp. NPDC048297]|uniref:hypothetical protein n=1 Tax=Streptomyces sp. NPDC048297 TaxID=3365531 RepID=UPI00371857BE
MYGHGAAPPTRGAGNVITLRVLIAACGLLSCGILACAPLFRVAFLRGRWFDWLVAWVSLPLGIFCFAVVGSVPESDRRGDVALATVLILGVAATVHFLVMDVRYRSKALRPPTGDAPPHAQTAPTAYGYPGPAAPYTATTAPVAPAVPAATPHMPFAAPQTPPSAPHTPIPGLPQAAPHTPIPGPPQTAPLAPPQRPAPARIDQVRAELDELSDYLRKNDGHEGGR